MAEVAGLATSYDLPNYIGDLFQKAEQPNAVLRLIGGLTGAIRTVQNTDFTMGVDYELPAAAQPNIVEGAAPTASNTDTAQSDNVVQIFQEAVEQTYSLQGRAAQITGIAMIPGAQSGGHDLNNPSSLEWQIARANEKIARQANYSFLRGAFVRPANNATARRTRGFRTAVTTNDFNMAAAALAIGNFETQLENALGNGMFQMGEEIYVLGDATAIAKVIGFYKATGVARFTDTTERVGVSIRQILTDFCTLNLVYEPDAAAGEIILFRPERCRVVAMPIPNKGVLFAEPLAKSGAAEKWQVYGELGIDYGHEVWHGVIRNYT